MNINIESMKQLEAISGEKLTLNSLLCAIRKADGISQVAFAKKLGISKQYLCDIEYNRRFVSPSAAYQYAQLLGYSPEQFVRLALQAELDHYDIPYIVDIHRNAA